MINFTDSFDPLNSTYMMDPARLKSLEDYLDTVLCVLCILSEKHRSSSNTISST